MDNFYAPGLKGPLADQVIWMVSPFVCLSVGYSVQLTNKVQY